jgi:hypothetical protein
VICALVGHRFGPEVGHLWVCQRCLRLIPGTTQINYLGLIGIPLLIGGLAAIVVSVGT